MVLVPFVPIPSARLWSAALASSVDGPVESLPQAARETGSAQATAVARSRVIMNHPPSGRRAFPNRREPACSVGFAGSAQNILTRRQRVIPSERPDLEVVVAEDLIGASRLPEPRPHLIADSVWPTHQSRPTHRRRRTCVGGQVGR